MKWACRLHRKCACIVYTLARVRMSLGREKFRTMETEMKVCQQRENLTYLTLAACPLKVALLVEGGRRREHSTEPTTPARKRRINRAGIYIQTCTENDIQQRHAQVGRTRCWDVPQGVEMPVLAEGEVGEGGSAQHLRIKHAQHLRVKGAPAGRDD